MWEAKFHAPEVAKGSAATHPLSRTARPCGVGCCSRTGKEEKRYSPASRQTCLRNQPSSQSADRPRQTPAKPNVYKAHASQQQNNIFAVPTIALHRQMQLTTSVRIVPLQHYNSKIEATMIQPVPQELTESLNPQQLSCSVPTHIKQQGRLFLLPLVRNSLQ